MPRGARAPTAWLKSRGSVRKVLAKSLGAEQADNFVLTGTERMQGKISSLSMVSQSMARHKKAVAAMRMKDCFASTSAVHLSMLASVAKTRFHSRYSVVYREGAGARNFYILVHGTIQQTTHDGHVAELITVEAGGAQMCFGTEGVAGGMHRLSTVTCVSDCEVLHCSTAGSGRLDARGIEVLATRAFAAFIEQELAQMPCFFDLRPAVSHEIACMLELRDLGEMGIVIFSPGMPSDELFILVKGRVALQDGDGFQFAKLSAGTVEDGYPFFGQEALLKGGARLEFAVTTTPCKILALPRKHFAHILKLAPKLHDHLSEFHELQQSRAELAKQIRHAQGVRMRTPAADRVKHLREQGIVNEGDDDTMVQAKIFATDCMAKHTRAILARRSE